MNYAQKLGAANLADPNGTRKALPHDKQNKVMGENLCMATRYRECQITGGGGGSDYQVNVCLSMHIILTL